MKNNRARVTPETVDKIMRISKGINHDSVVIIIEVFSNVITLVWDVEEKENVGFFINMREDMLPTG
jgi:hypothetical protein